MIWLVVVSLFRQNRAANPVTVPSRWFEDEHKSKALLWRFLPGATMSEPLVVSIPHRLGKDKALRRLKTGFAEVGTKFGHLFSVREQTWIGDHLRFQVSALGQSATGTIDVGDDYVSLEVFLPWLLARLIGTIEPLIRKEGRLLIEKK